MNDNDNSLLGGGHEPSPLHTDFYVVDAKSDPCEKCMADRRRAALIGVGIGVSLAAGIGLLLLPFVARR